jgi:SulP family sulfate permease
VAALLRRLLPIAGELRAYDGGKLRGDLSAGLTVGVMLIPQGMAYALIAGLEPIYGLYAALTPLAVYALFGTSRPLSVGPVAMVSLLVAAGVAPLAGADPERYIALAILLAAMVGVIQLALGLARFGFLVNFLSHPVLTGFTAAAALIIGFSQLKHLLGVALPRSNHVHTIIASAVRQAGSTHAITLAIGVAAVAILVALRRWRPSFPAQLAVVVLGTVAVGTLSLDAVGVQIVTAVPGGLPSPRMPAVSAGDLRALLPTALIISMVGFMESIAVAKVYASRDRYEVDASQELVALGLANMAGSVFRAYPTTGGFSRTAVNDRAGARTTLSSLFAAGVIALTLLFLTPLFHYLPNAVLAAIVMVAVSGLIDWREARFLWHVKRRDFFLMAMTFAATLALGIEQGILLGVVASLVVLVHESYRPHTAVMGRLPGTATFRNVRRHPEALVRSGIVVFRVDAPLFFGNAGFLKDKLREISDRDPVLHTLVLDAYPVNQIDSTAAHALKEIVEEFRAAGIRFFFVGVKGPVRDVLERSGIVDLVGAAHFFFEVHQATEAAEAEAPLSPDPAPDLRPSSAAV